MTLKSKRDLKQSAFYSVFQKLASDENKRNHIKNRNICKLENMYIATSQHHA